MSYVVKIRDHNRTVVDNDGCSGNGCGSDGNNEDNDHDGGGDGGGLCSLRISHKPNSSDNEREYDYHK